MNRSANLKNANRRTAGWLVLIVAGMFGFGFALVPLYNVFCELTGLGGRTNSEAVAVRADAAAVDTERTITVEFIASLNSGAPWVFKPSVSKMRVHPGQLYQTSYMAKNLSAQALTGQAVPSVAPPTGARFFKKIECFCFNRQDFAAGESKDMPVVFRIDPALPEEITTITLSYTFYRLENPDS